MNYKFLYITLYIVGITSSDIYGREPMKPEPEVRPIVPIFAVPLPPNPVPVPPPDPLENHFIEINP